MHNCYHMIDCRQSSPVKIKQILLCSLSNFGGNLPVYIKKLIPLSDLR